MQSSAIKSFYILSSDKDVIKSNVTKRITVDEFREMLADMKQKALERNINKLLLDATSVDFSDVTMSERHDIGLAAAEILKGDFKGVLVMQKEFINKHGENVATNRGADVLVTDNFDEAHQWLLK